MFGKEKSAENIMNTNSAAKMQKQRKEEEKQRSKQLRKSARKFVKDKKQKDRNIRQRRVVRTVSDCLQYEAMFETGICEVEQGVYSLTMAFTDVNFQLARSEEQKNIFTQSG